MASSTGYDPPDDHLIERWTSLSGRRGWGQDYALPHQDEDNVHGQESRSNAVIGWTSAKIRALNESLKRYCLEKTHRLALEIMPDVVNNVGAITPLWMGMGSPVLSVEYGQHVPQRNMSWVTR